MADYERAWRAKERAEAEKKAAQVADIIESREQMAIQKQRVLSQAAQMEKEQFQRILQVSCLLSLPLPSFHPCQTLMPSLLRARALREPRGTSVQ